ncbi:30S ribosomal protein S4e [Candidatus Woesearchaeota archaeon]|nr:30S ribosomal protein S4e [Candidatus Woesearchaeota archaeon]
MVQNHLSRLAAPRVWGLKRKTTKWIARPIPGPHPLKLSLTLSFLLRDILEYAKTTKEVKKILNEGQILVDGVVRKEYRFPVGLMDVLEIPKLNEYYRVVYNNNGRFSLVAIKKDEIKLKLLRIIRKTVVKSGKLQLTFHDGRNILVNKFDGNVGDSVLFDLTKGNISKIINLKKGSLVYLSGGSHVGKFGKVKDVIKAKDLQKPKVIVEVDDSEYITIADYAFVLGDNKPEISLEVKK